GSRRKSARLDSMPEHLEIVRFAGVAAPQPDANGCARTDEQFGQYGPAGGHVDVRPVRLCRLEEVSHRHTSIITVGITLDSPVRGKRFKAPHSGREGL